MTAILRRAAHRDLREPQIIETFRAAGATVQQLSAKGVPDLLVGFLGLTHLVEVKTDNAGLGPDQQIWHTAWRGEPVLIVRNEAQARKCIRVWTLDFAKQTGALARNDDDRDPVPQVQGKVEDQPA